MRLRVPPRARTPAPSRAAATNWGDAMQMPDGLPAEIDLTRPSAARVYDYFLGGAHNFEIDRQLAEQIASMTPNLAATMRSGREFLRRAVRALLDAGIDQFLDIGSGIPTVGNVHEVAQAANPKARIVYVDIDPVAVAHSRELLAGNDLTAVIHADLREPERILAEARDLRPDRLRPAGRHPARRGGALHPGRRPARRHPGHPAGRRRARQLPGHLALHLRGPAAGDARRAAALGAYRHRDHAALPRRDQPFFGDWTILEPGVVHMPLWRPDSPSDVDEHPERFGAFGGVARYDQPAG